MALQLRPLYSAVAGEAMLLTAMCSLQQLVLSCWGATRARLVVCQSKSDTLVVNVGELGGEAAEEQINAAVCARQSRRMSGRSHILAQHDIIMLCILLAVCSMSEGQFCTAASQALVQLPCVLDRGRAEWCVISFQGVVQIAVVQSTRGRLQGSVCL